MELNSYTLEDVIAEVRERAQDEGVSDEATWHELVEEVIEDHVDLGQIDPDQNTEQWKEVVKHMWKDYRLEQAGDDGESEESE